MVELDAEYRRLEAAAMAKLAKENKKHEAAKVADPLTLCRDMMASALMHVDDLGDAGKGFVPAMLAVTSIAEAVDRIERSRLRSPEDESPFAYDAMGPRHTTARVPRGMTREKFEPLLIAWTAALDRDPVEPTTETRPTNDNEERAALRHRLRVHGVTIAATLCAGIEIEKLRRWADDVAVPGEAVGNKASHGPYQPDAAESPNLSPLAREIVDAVDALIGHHMRHFPAAWLEGLAAGSPE